MVDHTFHAKGRTDINQFLSEVVPSQNAEHLVLDTEGIAVVALLPATVFEESVLVDHPSVFAYDHTNGQFCLCICTVSFLRSNNESASLIAVIQVYCRNLLGQRMQLDN